MNQNNQYLEEGSIHSYYPLSSIPETQLLIEQEHFYSNLSNCTSHTSTTKIITALGLVTGIFCFAGLELCRSMNIEAKINNITAEAVNINLLENRREITLQEFVWRIEEQAIGKSTRQSLADRNSF